MKTSAATAAGRRRAGAPAGARPVATRSTRRAPARTSRRTPRVGALRLPARLPAISIGALRTVSIGSWRTVSNGFWRTVSSGSWRTRALLAIAAAGALAIGYFGWLRDSPLVAVRQVKVAGVTSADRERIVAALTDAARGMTTFHVDTDRLQAAARSFPTVASVSADPRFPHAMTIHVTERRAALIAVNGERQVPVAADGTLLPALRVDGENLPRLAVAELPATGRLSGDARHEAIAIGEAPAALRPLIDGASVSPDYGVVLGMRGGIELRFGEPRDMEAKWTAIAAILADRGLTGLDYVDARVAERPAVG